MKKIKLFVTCNKIGEVPETNSDIFIPIQTGKALTGINLGVLGDDTGDNISEKNDKYCELTAHYWIWKNVHDAEYVGICHYRRYFNYVFSENNIDNLFKRADVIMVTPKYNLHDVQFSFLKYIASEDIAILHQVLRKVYPEYEKAFIQKMLGTLSYEYNMLICRKELFDSYCEWIFNILKECDKYLKPSPYSNAQRVKAYIAEYLMSVYFSKNNYKIKTLDLKMKTSNGFEVIRANPIKKALSLLINLRRYFVKTISMYGYAQINGLKKDGISLFDSIQT